MSTSRTENKERWARRHAGDGRPESRSSDRLPPGQHLTKGFPVLDLGVHPAIHLADWRLEVGGLVENPVTLTWAEFNALPQVEVSDDFHCVTTWTKFDCTWGGVSLAALCDLVRPTPEARCVFFTGYDGYSTNTPLEALRDPHALVATRFDGEPLTSEHGAPARVILPKLYAWKGANFVRALDFLAQDKLGFWEVRGYSNTADPWTEDRFSST